MLKKVLALGLVSLFISSLGVSVFAQEEENPAVTASVPAQEPQVSMSMTEEGNVSLDFREADINNVLRVLSVKSGINIVPSPEISGTVTIHLKDVPWEQALNVILQTRGYAYEKRGNIITVMTIEELKVKRENDMLLTEQEPLETEVFTLNFGKASEIIASIDRMKSERGSINFDQRTNTIIVTDTPKNIGMMAAVIDRLDATTPQVLIESKIVETTLNDTENLGISWTAKISANASSITHTYPFTPPSIDSKYVTNAITTTNSAITNGTLSFNEFAAVLEMLKTRTDTNILSNPRIVTLDNKEATIDVGREYPYPQKFFNKDTGTWQLSGWEYKKIGITLRVTPHVSAAGFVTMDVNPVITENVGDVTDPESGTSVPELSVETATTRVMVKDGDTLVIGGLVKDKTTDIKRKVPFLGDIPIFGLLFQKKDKTVAKTDLLIFITPTIITPEIDLDTSK